MFVLPLFLQPPLSSWDFSDVVVWSFLGFLGAIFGCFRGFGEAPQLVAVLKEMKEGLDVVDFKVKALIAKAKGLSISGHPIVQSLVQTRLFLEKVCGSRDFSLLPPVRASAADADLSTSKRENGGPAQKREEAGRKETCSGWLWRGRPLVDRELELLLEQALLAGLLVLSGGAHARG
ncbi:hypothetical protein ACLB2K_053402 [Fragaria x ananassa]